MDVPEFYNRRVILTREKEKELLVAAKSGDAIAREELIFAHLSFVVYLAKKKNQHRDIEIIHYGIQGLLIAIDKFNTSLNYRFSTFARHWILQQIIEGMQIKSNLSKMSLKTRKMVIEKKLMHPVDIDDDVLYNLLPVKPHVERDLIKIQMKDEVKTALSELTDREADIVVNHLMEETCTLGDLGVKYGITRERIRQIEELALGKLRIKLRGYKSLAYPEED